MTVSTTKHSSMRNDEELVTERYQSCQTISFPHVASELQAHAEVLDVFVRFVFFFCHFKLRVSLICRGERFCCRWSELLVLNSSNFVQLQWFHWASGGSVKTKWSVNSNSTVQVVSQRLKNKANQRQLLGNAWVRKKIWALRLGLLFSWRMPLKTRTFQDNLEIQGLWLTSFCPQIQASLFHIKLAVSTTTCVFFPPASNQHN